MMHFCYVYDFSVINDVAKPCAEVLRLQTVIDREYHPPKHIWIRTMDH